MARTTENSKFIPTGSKRQWEESNGDPKIKENDSDGYAKLWEFRIEKKMKEMDGNKNIAGAMLGSRCYVAGLRDAYDKYLKQAHIAILERTPFRHIYHFPDVVQDTSLLKALVLHWEEETMSFCLGQRRVKLTEMETSIILGLPITGKHVEFDKSKVSGHMNGDRGTWPPDWVKRLFPRVEDGHEISMTEIDVVLKGLCQSTDEEDIQDVARAFILYLFMVVLFQQWDNSCPQELMHYLVDHDVLWDFAWGSSVQEFLLLEVSQIAPKLHLARGKGLGGEMFINGCTILLTVWFYEHVRSDCKFEGSDSVAFPRILRWIGTRSDLDDAVSSTIHLLSVDKVLAGIELTAYERRWLKWAVDRDMEHLLGVGGIEGQGFVYGKENIEQRSAEASKKICSSTVAVVGEALRETCPAENAARERKPNAGDRNMFQSEVEEMISRSVDVLRTEFGAQIEALKQEIWRLRRHDEDLRRGKVNEDSPLEAEVDDHALRSLPYRRVVHHPPGGPKLEGLREQALAGSNGDGKASGQGQGNEQPQEVVKGQEMAGQERLLSTDYENQEEEFHDFEEESSSDKFQCGQVWALYSDLNEYPNYYAQIKNIEREKFRVDVAWLEACTLRKVEIRWEREGLPIACGRFEVTKATETYDTTDSFSHIVSAKPAIEKAQYDIYPVMGEVWALFKSWHVGWKLSDLKNADYEIVEVLLCASSGMRVQKLKKVGGCKAVFMPKERGDVLARMDVPADQYLRFSHRIPAFKLTEERGGQLRDYWELDTASVPDVS